MKSIKISSKHSVGIHPVYDIQVKDAHHYILENGVVSHNSGFLFASSIIVSMEAFKLKQDEDGNKITDTRGIRSKCKIVKSRYNKPFEAVEVHIPYQEGMDPYSGLFELFEKQQLITKEGNRYVYLDLSGVEHKHWRKDYLANKDNVLDLIMNEFDEDRVIIPQVVESTEEE
jgi:hypothetical protein